MTIKRSIGAPPEEYVSTFLPYSIDRKTERAAREMVAASMTDARVVAIIECATWLDEHAKGYEERTCNALRSPQKRAIIGELREKAAGLRRLAKEPVR